MGVKHESKTNKFLSKMRPYMPGEDREFLQEIEKEMSITSWSTYVSNMRDILITLYNKCIENLSLRSRHGISTFIFLNDAKTWF